MLSTKQFVQIQNELFGAFHVPKIFVILCEGNHIVFILWAKKIKFAAF